MSDDESAAGGGDSDMMNGSTFEDNGESLNSRIRHHSAISDSVSPETNKRKVPRSEVSVLTSTALNTVGWLEETIIREKDKKRLGVATTELIMGKIKSLKTQIGSFERAVSAVNVSPVVSDTFGATAALVDEFARVVAIKERRIVELEGIIDRTNVVPIQPTYANVAGVSASQVVDAPTMGRRSRGQAPPSKKRNTSKVRSKSRADARSKSRIAARTVALSKMRAESPKPVFRIKVGDQVKALKAKNELWSEVCRKTKTPKIVALSTKSGDLVLKPQNRESTDILAAMAKTSLSNVTADTPRRPRIQIFNVDASIEPGDLSGLLATQNTELGVEIDSAATALVPIFKRGPRERPTVHWVFEVSPALYSKLSDGHVFIGFNRCRVAKYEEITQCYKCLRFGHPANKCSAVNESCSNCGQKGHKSVTCSSPTKCSNCGGAHAALDKTCSARTRALMNLLGRTDFGKGTPTNNPQ